MVEPRNAPGLENFHVLLYHSGLVCDLILSGLLPSFMIKADSGRQTGLLWVAVAVPLEARLATRLAHLKRWPGHRTATRGSGWTRGTRKRPEPHVAHFSCVP